MIESMIGCLIVDAIFQPNRHGRTESGDAGKKGEQGKRRGEREEVLYSIRLPKKGFRMTDMYISCILAHLPAVQHTIVIYSKR